MRGARGTQHRHAGGKIPSSLNQGRMPCTIHPASTFYPNFIRMPKGLHVFFSSASPLLTTLFPTPYART